MAEVNGVKKEIKKTTSIFTSTNEVESVNHMSVEWDNQVNALAATNPVLTTPLGYNAKIILPVDSII